ncbi:hypothetical protein quinque_000707 [Culex quinquefasciatus]
MVSSSDVNRALEACGYSSVGGDLAGIIASGVNRATGSDRNEAAMFTAQLIHESGGFQFREEQGGANQHYTPYHGRGFIQLTHDYNYRPASQDLYGDDRLMRDPGLVSRDARTSMDVSVWFWQKNVRNRGGPISAHLVAIVAIGVSSVVQDRNEAAMCLAHLIHSSSGFRQREEIDSSTPFHGRGFIQLSREDSYREASQELNGDEQALVDDPDIVTLDAWQAMKVALEVQSSAGWREQISTNDDGC